jgi:hypothetical protein
MQRYNLRNDTDSMSRQSRDVLQPLTGGGAFEAARDAHHHAAGTTALERVSDIAALAVDMGTTTWDAVSVLQQAKIIASSLPGWTVPSARAFLRRHVSELQTAITTLRALPIDVAADSDQRAELGGGRTKKEEAVIIAVQAVASAHSEMWLALSLQQRCEKIAEHCTYSVEEVVLLLFARTASRLRSSPC